MKYNRRSIRKLRLERGLGLGETAKAARITERTLIYIEKGFSDPRASTLGKLATVFGVTVDAFYVKKDVAA